MIFLAAAVVFLLLTGAFWQSWRERRDRVLFAPPGEHVPSTKLHVVCRGNGRPVVLEAGIAASSVGWSEVQKSLAEFCRVCAADRPGLGWSAASDDPLTPEQFLRHLRSVTAFAGRPAILVGHSFGGLLVQLYAATFPEDVAGLVLVDPAPVSEWAEPSAADLARLQRGARLSRRGAWLVRSGFVRLALTLLTRGSHRASKALASAASGRARGYLEGLIGQVRKLPPELWPVVQAHWCRPASFLSMAEHLESLPVIAQAVRDNPIPGNMPVTVISGGHLTVAQLADHAGIVSRSTWGKHLVAEGSAHWVHLDAPEVIVSAVRIMLLQT